MKTYDLPTDLESFRESADWDSHVSYHGSPITVSLNPPEGFSESDELEFFRSEVSKIQALIPGFTDEAKRRLLPEINRIWNSGQALTPEGFISKLKPRFINIDPEETSIQFSDIDDILEDHAIIAKVDRTGRLISLEIE